MTHSTQQTRAFRRRSLQPISWHSTEETEPNTTKASNTRTSPSARRKSHHTALSNAATCNSQCPSTVVSIDDNGMVHALHLSVNISTIWRSSGSNAAAPVTPLEPIFTKGEKTCPDSRSTRMQNFTPLAFFAAEKSVTIQTKKNTVSADTTVWWDKNSLS